MELKALKFCDFRSSITDRGSVIGRQMKLDRFREILFSHFVRGTFLLPNPLLIEYPRIEYLSCFLLKIASIKSVRSHRSEREFRLKWHDVTQAKPLRSISGSLKIYARQQCQVIGIVYSQGHNNLIYFSSLKLGQVRQ